MCVLKRGEFIEMCLQYADSVGAAVSSSHGVAFCANQLNVVGTSKVLLGSSVFFLDIWNKELFLAGILIQ